MKVKICPQCKEEFEDKRNRKTFCSHSCANRAHAYTLELPHVKKAQLRSVTGKDKSKEAAEKNKSYKFRICRQCGCEYYSNSPSFCSQQCVGVFQSEPPLMRKAKDAFFQQRNAASHRGIDWELTFVQWWKFWKQSGKWKQRGRGKGQYVMARYGDEGPYALDNIRIVTSDANLAERLAPKGELNAFSKLREGDIRKIRGLEDTMSRHEIAALFGINYWHVRDIQKRRCWKHVE